MSNSEQKPFLKPCPFCGNEEVIVERYGNYKRSTIILCEECGCRLKSNEEGSSIGNKWNKRKDIENNSDLIKLSRWLMGYVMDLHSFRNQLFKNKDYESMKTAVRDNFPQLQGFQQQQLFKKLGIDAKANQDAIRRAVKYIAEDKPIALTNELDGTKEDVK